MKYVLLLLTDPDQLFSYRAVLEYKGYGVGAASTNATLLAELAGGLWDLIVVEEGESTELNQTLGAALATGDARDPAIVMLPSWTGADVLLPGDFVDAVAAIFEERDAEGAG